MRRSSGWRDQQALISLVLPSSCLWSLLGVVDSIVCVIWVWAVYVHQPAYMHVFTLMPSTNTLLKKKKNSWTSRTSTGPVGRQEAGLALCAENAAKWHNTDTFAFYFTLSYFRSIPSKTAWRASCLTRCTSSMPLVARQQAPSSRASPALPQWCNASWTWPEHRHLQTPALVVLIHRERQLCPACTIPEAQDLLHVWSGHYFLRVEQPEHKQNRCPELWCKHNRQNRHSCWDL